MAKKKGLTHDQQLTNALKQLPNPLEDKKHRIMIYFINDQARSNQSRFEHIIEARHKLVPNDIKRIQQKINQSILKMDSERINAYNIFIKRNNYSDEYIQISVSTDFKKTNKVVVKTIFITRNLK